MKEFNKRFENNCPFPEINCGDLSCKVCENIRRSTWREALEWVIGEHGPLNKRINNCDCARGRIEKELEEE